MFKITCILVCIVLLIIQLLRLVRIDRYVVQFDDGKVTKTGIYYSDNFKIPNDMGSNVKVTVKLTSISLLDILLGH